MTTKYLIWILAVLLLVGISEATSTLPNGLVEWFDLHGIANANENGSANIVQLTRIGTVGAKTMITGGSRGEFVTGNMPSLQNLTYAYKLDGGFTVQAFVNYSGTRGGGNDNLVADSYSGGAPAGYLGFQLLDENTGPGFSYYQMIGGGSGCEASVGSEYSTANAVYQVVGTYNASANKIYLYINGAYVTECAVSGTASNGVLGLNIGNYGTLTGNEADGYTINYVGLWNRTLTPSEISELYMGGKGNSYSNFSAVVGGSSNFSVTATDEWGGSALNISVWVDGTFQYTNTTVSTTLLQNDTSLHTIIIGAANYFNRTYANQNVSSNLAGSLHQAEICFNATQKVNSAWVTANNFTIGSTVRTSCFNLSSGSHNVKAQKTGWFSSNQTFTVTALQNTTLTVQNLSYTNLTIYAKDGTTNASLSGYDVSINSISNPTFAESATGVTNNSFYLINDTYNVTLYKSGYAITTGTANITVSGHTNYTFTLYKSNSVSINILDEITNAPITSNITIRWTNNATTWENVTSSSQLFLYNLTPSDYTLLFYGSNYSTRTYSITVGNLSTQFLTAYMISSTYSTIFTVKDKDTGDIITDASFTMYKLVNSTWTTVESKYTDITGKVQVYYDPIGNYRFYLAKSDYEDLVFYLNPILFNTYDVFMVKGNLLNYSVDYDDISIIFSPTTFNNNANTTFNFLISSPDGLLTDYGIFLSYPGGNATASGVNAIGEQLSVSINITNATRWDRVTLTYNYTTSIAGSRTFTQYLSINTNATISENTWMANKDRTYGLGIFERLLIVTIIIIFTVGIATMVGQGLPGIAIGLFLFGFMVYIGFIPIWSIIPSMIIGVIFLVWKSGGY